MSDEPPPSFRGFVIRYFTFRTPAAMICDGVVVLVLHMVLRHAAYVLHTATGFGDPRDDMTVLRAIVHPVYLLGYAAELSFHLGVLLCAAGVAFEAARRLGRAHAENAAPQSPPGDRTVMP